MFFSDSLSVFLVCGGADSERRPSLLSFPRRLPGSAGACHVCPQQHPLCRYHRGQAHPGQSPRGVDAGTAPLRPWRPSLRGWGCKPCPPPRPRPPWALRVCRLGLPCRFPRGGLLAGTHCTATAVRQPASVPAFSRGWDAAERWRRGSDGTGSGHWPPRRSSPLRSGLAACVPALVLRVSVCVRVLVFVACECLVCKRPVTLRLLPVLRQETIFIYQAKLVRFILKSSLVLDTCLLIPSVV